MAIALSKFEGLCGFRPYSEIIFFLQGTDSYTVKNKFNKTKYRNNSYNWSLEIPEFQTLIGYELIDQFKNNIVNSQNILKDIFYKLMTSKKTTIIQNISNHKQYLQSLCK